MSLSQWFCPPRRLLVIFVAVMVALAAGLAWLGWRFVEQDQALETQRQQESLERAADLVAVALEQRLTTMKEQIPLAFSQPDTGDALLVRFNAAGIVAHRGAPLLYHPAATARTTVADEGLGAREAEFRVPSYLVAIVELERLAQTRDSSTQAAALVALGRNLRKANRLLEALKVYERLGSLEEVRYGDLPAGLLGAYERCAVLEKMGRRADVQASAAAFLGSLQRGRWAVDRDTWEYYFQQAAARWLNGAIQASSVDRSLTAGIEWLWLMRKSDAPEAVAASGARSLWIQDRPVIALWRNLGEQWVAVVATPSYLERGVRGAWAGFQVQVNLTDSEGHLALGAVTRPGGPQAMRAPSETRLPWTLRLTPLPTDVTPWASRRRTLLASFAVAALLVILASYVTARAIARELAVSRLQSEFVSAVSHEFRTPITSMGHLTELLIGGKVSPEESRQRFYPALARETKRLRRMVESLLNFARMEAGAEEYSFEALDLNDLLEEVLGDFRADMLGNGRRVDLREDRQAPPVLADRELLGRAFWNLLENALKYAPESPVIQVGVTREAAGVAVSVRDEGPGIHPDDKKIIFQKFVRGGASKPTNVKGTGIGLAIVEHIVRAHRGEIRVASELGRGSTFTIVLPPGEARP